MSPRRNRRRLDDLRPRDPQRAVLGNQSVQSWADGEWMVRDIPVGVSVKLYRCPGCLQEIRPGTGHVVSWPADGRGDESDRRHWHGACWRARERRSPTARR